MACAAGPFAYDPSLWQVEAAELAALAYSVLLSSALNYYLQTWAVQHLDASVITLWIRTAEGISMQLTLETAVWA